MNKIVYSITKIGKVENTKITGIGYATDTDIIVACTSTKKDSKPYIKVFENAVKFCYEIDSAEFKGLFTEIVEVPIEEKDGSTNKRVKKNDYVIWYKKAE